MKARLTLIAMATALCGCQTVWIHPNASLAKYEDDSYLCRYGEARPSEEQLRGRAQARSEEVPSQVIVPEPDPAPAEINTGEGTNVNVNVDLGDDRRPVVVPGRSPKRPKFPECMSILGWWPERRFGTSVPYARPGTASPERTSRNKKLNP